MEKKILDPGVQILAAIAGSPKYDYVHEGSVDLWAGSPFAWIRGRPSRQVGKIGEQLVAGLFAGKELDVLASVGSEAVS